MSFRPADQTDVWLGHRLVQLRRLKAMRQGVLARRIGITHCQLWRYECGITPLSVGRLLQIAAVLDFPVGAFLDGIQREVSRAA